MKKFNIFLVLAMSFSVFSTTALAENASDTATISPETPTIEVKDLLPSDYSPTKSYESYETVVSELGSNLREITPEEIERAKEVGYVEVNSPDELATLLEYGKDQQVKMKESNSLLEEKIKLANFIAPFNAQTDISILADRNSKSATYELRDWGNPLTGFSYLYGRTNIYYWNDTKKIDETTASSYMEGDISGHEWYPSAPEITADGYYHRYVRFLGDLKKFIIVNGRPSYTESIRIDRLTQIYSTNVIGK